MVQIPPITNWSVFPQNGDIGYFDDMNVWIGQGNTVIHSANASIVKMNEAIAKINNIAENAINVITFDNIAQLKLNSNIGRVDVLGYNTLGDGGGGTFYWDSTSTDSDDGGYTIQATGVTTGRWKRALMGKVSIQKFGAKGDGITDDKFAFVNAHNYVASIGGGLVEALSPKVNWKINSSMNWDTNKVSLKIDGKVDCSSMTKGALFNIIQSESDVNKRVYLNLMHPIIGGVFYGPSKSVANVRLVVIQDNVSSVCAGVTFRDGGAMNWDNIIYLGNGSFFTIFENYDFGSTNGSGGTRSVISNPTGFNSGERNRFVNCRFGIADTYIEQSNGNASTFFDGCSFNYCTLRMGYISGGSVHFIGGHIESDKDNIEWFSVTGQNALLNISNSDIVVGASKTAFPEFYVHSDCTLGGIFLSNIHYINSSSHTVPLIGGIGRALVNNFSASGVQPYIGECVNRLAYGFFETSLAANEWVLTGTTVPSISSDTSHSGAYSFKFQGIAGQNNSATFKTECNVGQKISLSFWAKASNYVTGGNFYGLIYYTDKLGNILGTASEIMNITSNTDWVKVTPNYDIVAPKGTAFAALSISFFGVSSGTPNGYIDDVIVNIS